MEAVSNLRLRWPDQLDGHWDSPPLVDYGGTGVAAFVESNPELAALVDKQATSTFWRLTPEYYSGHILRNQTRLYRWLLADQARRGDWNGFQKTTADQLAIAEGFGEGGLEWAATPSFATVVDELIDIASTTNVPPAILQALAGELASYGRNPEDSADALRLNSVGTADFLPEFYRRNLFSGSGFWHTQYSVQPRKALMALSRLGGSQPETTKRHLDAMFSWMVFEAGQAEYTNTSQLRDWEESLSSDGTWAFLGDDPVGRYIARRSVMREFMDSHVRNRARMRGAQLVFAIERFRQAKGRNPASLAELVPEYLAELPRDPFAKGGAALLGVLVDGSWRIYSVGPDQVDDGGSLPSGTSHREWRSHSDWIIRPTPHFEATRQSASSK